MGDAAPCRSPEAEPPGAPTWSRPSDIPGVVLHRAHLRRTVLVSLLVGTALFAINQLDVVLAGKATTATWVKSAITYAVPFCVANYGVLTATKRPRPRPGRPAQRA